MKIIVFDVNDAACSIVVSPRRYSLMIDCGSHSEKPCPVDQIINNYSDWLDIQSYTTTKGKTYHLSLLHITHPDDDHVRNARVLMEQMPPYLLLRRAWEDFPKDETINDEYKMRIDKRYRGKNPETIPWGFAQNKIFKIPMDTVLSDPELSQKVKNNSSILRFLEYAGVKVLFGGDLEKPGWDWLANNDSRFVDAMKDGIDVLVAPHHGHKSGFPDSLFELTGNVKIAVLSKATESDNQATDVSSQYSRVADGIRYKSLADKQKYEASGTLTTRSNGDIIMDIDSNGNISTYTQKASPNHSRL